MVGHEDPTAGPGPIGAPPQAPRVGRTLWAFNAQHLAYLEEYLQADPPPGTTRETTAPVTSGFPVSWNQRSIEKRRSARRSVSKYFFPNGAEGQ